MNYRSSIILLSSYSAAIRVLEFSAFACGRRGRGDIAKIADNEEKMTRLWLSVDGRWVTTGQGGFGCWLDETLQPGK
jgi:hypothetical protein